MDRKVAWPFCRWVHWRSLTFRPDRKTNRVMKSSNATAHRLSRAGFLAQTGTALLATIAGANAAVGETVSSSRSAKGKANSKVKRWDIITIGNLSRNQYWGEPNDTAVRKVLCTCTLIRGDS